ncbi:hypothetical protein OIHEL45_03605 [Sulfitobacter indolifex HEL-45]|uniref:Lipoprotein n=1 Tax=Sulfitobacter indolifex HEL-45 TaxID=391624 RepID=A0ABM9X8R8_9RHOB|nr:hypothetical protein OIHEL45_03605 [Sulfitobacter indolifex HEL-45]
MYRLIALGLLLTLAGCGVPFVPFI